MVIVQFTQPEYIVGEADGMLVLTVDKRGANNITPLQCLLLYPQWVQLVRELDYTLSAKYFTLISL